MKRSSQEMLFLVAGILLIAAPFAFGLLRAFNTGTDWRYLWVAVGALLGTSAVIAIGRSKSSTSAVTIGTALNALLIATLAAVLAAKFVGNTRSTATWIVSFAFAFCTTAGTVLYFVSKPRAD
jgi:hypothetical protein